jgi:16S rRNA (uracil1498-N3)-methyltransferase
MSETRKSCDKDSIMPTDTLKKAPRLYLQATLGPGPTVPLDDPQFHYLANVMRLGAGDAVLAFNGRDGEWLCHLDLPTRKKGSLICEKQTRPQPPLGDIWFAFAPLKTDRLDYLVQKAVEMGVSGAFPVFTERTQGRQFNAGKAIANMVEAAEQCGILSVPPLHDAQGLDRFLAAFPKERTLVFCDEEAAHENPVASIRSLAKGAPLAVLIGPVGGFSDAERKAIAALPRVLRISLGPRILRADTAAVAALALVQAVIGDW